MAKVRIESNGGWPVRVTVDGLDISAAVTSLWFDADGGSGAPRLSLELIPDEFLVDVDDAVVEVLRSRLDG